VIAGVIAGVNEGVIEGVSRVTGASGGVAVAATLTVALGTTGVERVPDPPQGLASPVVPKRPAVANRTNVPATSAAMRDDAAICST